MSNQPQPELFADPLPEPLPERNESQRIILPAPGSMRKRVRKTVMQILEERKAQGATTGYLMSWIEEHKPALALRIEMHAQANNESDRIQQWKTHLGHALDDLQNEKRVHCDEIGKRTMQGDSKASCVWRTIEDWEALREHSVWMLRENRHYNPRPYGQRLQAFFQSLSFKTANQ